MYNIEKYTEGTLDQIATVLFERKMRRDNSFKTKVILYQRIDEIMSGERMAVEAEYEMKKKKIDVVAAGFVNEYKLKKRKPENIIEFLSLC